MTLIIKEDARPFIVGNVNILNINAMKLERERNQPRRGVITQRFGKAY